MPRLPTLALLALSISGIRGYMCPSYDSIATPAVTSSNWALNDYTGDWYVLATSEPTLPSLCTCPTLKWYVDSAGGIKKYHYTMVANCGGMNFSATMKGEARDPAHPGLLEENLALFNHSVAPYVPNMIYDTQTLPDGNVIGFSYACLLGHTPGINMFSFNIVARKPTLTIEATKALAAAQSSRTHGAFKMDGIRYSDGSVCNWKQEAVIV